ncbi:MAG: hypothetical protein EOO18_13370 [Chryseobacterium sp.]|nr:MAG: hypothetical protein EOO18_13370 [Chryseobacterium sp.]
MDKEIVLAYYQKLSDAEILHAVETDIKGLTPEAQEIVKEEIKRRRLNPDLTKVVDEQQIIYEHIPRVYDPEGCPVEEDRRIWIERAFQLLLTLFGEAEIKKRTVLLPTGKDFPVNFDGSEQAAFETLQIVARQMEVPAEKIALDFYDENLQMITEGSPGGMYWGKGDTGKFEISLAKEVLATPENMIATLAHEIAHIKLLGEERINENDEPLTDLATVFFGLGIFNANAAFVSFRDARSLNWSTSGYLTQMEWGYALALFAILREEMEPEWINFLTTNIRADFKQGMQFILNNPEKIFANLEESEPVNSPIAGNNQENPGTLFPVS